ncbi:hypothetical protein, partial [Paenibacillus uliginis]|uniref:hypothetical protein n=1 Tax=Paenibacillus uliginis TaxID=683737 RepID=UPI001AEC99D2
SKLLIKSARLACIRHAASVRPEPGSNSPLKDFSSGHFLNDFKKISNLPNQFKERFAHLEANVFNVTFVSLTCFICSVFKELVRSLSLIFHISVSAA